MDWKTLIASIIGSLSWPLSILVVVLIFRKSINGFLGNLEALNYKGIELRKKVSELVEKNEIPQFEIEKTASNKEKNGIFMKKYKYFLELATKSISLAIREAWYDFEMMTSSVCNKHAKEVFERNLQFNEMIKVLQNKKLLTAYDADLLIVARNLRNEILFKATDPKISVNAVAEYAMMISNISGKLSSAANLK